MTDGRRRRPGSRHRTVKPAESGGGQPRGERRSASREVVGSPVAKAKVPSPRGARRTASKEAARRADAAQPKARAGATPRERHAGQASAPSGAESSNDPAPTPKRGRTSWRWRPPRRPC